MCEVGRVEKSGGSTVLKFSGAPEVFYLINPQHIFNPVRGHARRELKDARLLLTYPPLNVLPYPTTPTLHTLLPQPVLHPDCRRYGLSGNRSRNVTPDRHISQDHRLNMFPISSI